MPVTTGLTFAALIAYLLWQRGDVAAPLSEPLVPSGGALLPGGSEMPVNAAPVTASPASPASGGTAVPAPSGGGLSPSPPGARGFSLSSEAQTKLGLSVTKQVTKWFLTPIEQTMDLSPEAQAAWGEYRLGEQADYTSWVTEQTPPTFVDDLSLVDNDAALAALETGEGLTGEAASAVETGVIEAAPLASEGVSNLSVALQGLGIAAALTDMGFAIAGKLPDAEKAVIAALDAAIIGAMFIPVYGWVVGLALGIVRGIIGLFGNELFGSPTLSHKQREALEVQRTASTGLNPWMQQVAATMTPRDLLRVLIAWGSGYCGGTSSVAIGVTLYNAQGDWFGVGSPGCYWNVGHHFHEWPDTAAMTLDDMALALVTYGEAEAHIGVQAGVAQHYLDDMNTAGLTLLQKRLAAWGELIAQGATLDDIDALAFEQRQTPRWNQVAGFFGMGSWHELVGWHLQDLWTRYLVTSRSGSLSDFARKQGFPSWLVMRDTIMIPYERTMTAVEAFDRQMAVYDGRSIATVPIPALLTPRSALAARVGSFGDRLTLLEAGCQAWLDAAPARAAEAAAVAAANQLAWEQYQQASYTMSTG